jgi:hypothetical protein
MGVDATRPAFNFKPKYRVTMLTRGSGTHPVVNGLVWFTDPRWRGPVLVYRQTVGRRPSFSLARYATVFQGELHAIVACAHDIQSHSRPEKHVFSLSQTVLKVVLPSERTHWFNIAKR